MDIVPLLRAWWNGNQGVIESDPYTLVVNDVKGWEHYGVATR